MATAAGGHNFFVNKVMELQESAERFAAMYARRANAIDMTIIVLSVITSGAMWALAADVLPKILGWVGAAISTLVTFLTLYMYASGLQKKRKKALVLYTEITQCLGRIRGAQNIADDEFWETYKRFEANLTSLQYGQED
jgi:hypothetical protein